MGIVIFRNLRSISFGAAASVAAASTFRRLTATCGLVLLTQVLARTAWITIVAMSAQPTTITGSTVFQSAVSLVNVLRLALSALTRGSGAWQGEEERRSPVATG